MKIYDLQIKKLEQYIENFHNPDVLKDLDFAPRMGLCYNCYLESIYEGIRDNIFKKWKYFSGDMVYPLGEKEYVNGDLLLSNPLRLHLAVWVLSNLKVLNTVESKDLTFYVEDIYRDRDDFDILLSDSLDNTYDIEVSISKAHIDLSFDHEFGTEKETGVEYSIEFIGDNYPKDFLDLIEPIIIEYLERTKVV